MKLRGKSIGSQKCAHGKVLGPFKHAILVAGMGTSPTVLTNAVWALAYGETPVVPDGVVALITKNGKELLRCEKIAVDGKLVFGETSIRVTMYSINSEWVRTTCV